MKFRFHILTLLFALLTSCADQNFDWRMNRLTEYGQDFVTQYGWPDSRQTWKTAIQYKVTVNVENGGVWNLKVYSADPVKEPKKAYLLGNFDVNIDTETGKANVLVDGPYTLSSIYVGISDGDVYAAKSVATSEDGLIDVSFEEEEFAQGTLPSAPKMAYMIAYEIVDSASTFLDFNDIVLEVTHVSGEETANLRLRAVGAKEAMKISFKGDDKETVLYKDAHYAFGYHNPNFLINVESGDHKYRTPIKYNNLNVGKDFSIVEDAYRFVVSVAAGKKKSHEFYVWPEIKEYYGLPANAVLVANPNWDWVSEGGKVERKHKSFKFWAQTYHLYNQWWDDIWDPHALVIQSDGSYRPDFDYEQMIYGVNDLKKTGGKVPDISWQVFDSYTKAEIGVNISFVLVGRNNGRIKISMERSDGGLFEWYPTDEDGVSRAYVDVYDKNMNVDTGAGTESEACHILLSTKTIQQIINQRATLRVTFDAGETETQINSVWIRER